MSLLILSASDVDQAITKFKTDELVDVMARVFLALSTTHRGSIENEQASTVSIPHRSTIASKNHNVLFMPSRLSAIGTAIKIVSVPVASAPPEVKSHGLPGSTMIIDENSGNVVAVVNARKLTALRNAASSLLATELMLPTDSSPRMLVAVGAGAQIYAHVALFLSAYPSISTCKVFNRTMNDRLRTLLLSLRSLHPSIAIDGFSLSEQAGSAFVESITSANIIITATSATTPLFPSSCVSPGTHLCLIGSYTPAMHEVDGNLIRRAGKIVVDYKEGATIEAGELISAKMGAEDVLELGQLINPPASSSPKWSVNQTLAEQVRASGDVTIFKSVGVGIQDVAIAHAVVDCARKHELGTLIGNYDAL